MFWRNLLQRDRMDREWRQEMESHIQMLTDSFLAQGLTPRETLAFWAALRGLDPRRAPPLTDAALAAFGLAEVADWPCRRLSAGQRRRLGLARLLAVPAPIWLLDEPTSTLDHDNQRRLENAIVGHRAKGGRVAVASHVPIDIGDATILTLDAFAHAAGFAAAG